MRASRVLLGLISIITAAVAASNDTSETCTRTAKRNVNLNINSRTQFDLCMSQEDAQQVADNYQNLIADYSTTLANASFTADLKWYSDSVITLVNSGCKDPIPLGTVLFDSLEALSEGQGSQPNVPFFINNLWFSCNEVAIRWRSAQEPEQITGITVLVASRAPPGWVFPWLINTVYAELNSGAWLVNLGVYQPQECSGTVTPNSGG